MGKQISLGRFGSQESKEAFNRLIAAINNGHPSPQSALVIQSKFMVFELVRGYLAFAKGDPESDDPVKQKPRYGPKELQHLNRAAAVLLEKELTPCDEFGSVALKEIRAEMVGLGWSRSYIGQQVTRIRRIFKWGVSEEMVPEKILLSHKSIEPLQDGVAPESEPVEPIDDKWIAATIPFLSPVVSMMVRLQRLACMRPGEVCAMKPSEIIEVKKRLVFQPKKHKTAKKKKSRTAIIPTVLESELRRYLNRNPEDYLFSPRESVEWQLAQRLQNRKTPFTPSQRKRKRRISTRITDRYTTRTYGQAIEYAIAAANETGLKIPHWSPGQMRHTAADEVDFLLESPRATQIMLGHANLNTQKEYLSQQVKTLIVTAKKLERKRKPGLLSPSHSAERASG